MAKPHQIHLLQFDFSVIQAAGESVANDLQHWVQVSLLPVIDEVLEQVSAELGLANNVAYRLGKLTLDLGSVFADESDIETARRLRSQLTTLLLEQLSGQMRPSSQTMSDVSVQIESLTQHHAILQGFLQTGRLNWEHSAHPSVAHRQVLRHALMERRQAVAILADEQLEFLRGVVRDERQCTRLLRQYETSELLLVARHFLNTWPVQQAELALDWISLELSRLESDTNGARCEEFWRYVLNTLEASVQSKDQQALKLVTPWLLDCAGRHALSVHDVEPEPETNALAAYQSFIEKNTRISNQAKAALQQVLANLRQPLLLTQAKKYATDKVTLTEADLQGHLQAANLDVLSLHWQSLMTRQAHTVRHIYAKLNAQQKVRLTAALPLQKQIELAQILRPTSANLTAEIAQAAEQLAKIISQEAETITANQLREQWCHAILSDDTDEQHAQATSASLLHKIIAPHLAVTDPIWQSLQVALIYQQPQLIHTRAALAAINATVSDASENDADQNTTNSDRPSFDIEIEQDPAHKADITRLLQQAKQTPASLQANLRKLIQNKNTFADFVNQLSEAHRHQLMIALISSAASENTSEAATSAAHQLLQKIENEAYQSRNIRSYIVSALQQLIEDQAIDFDILRAKYPASGKGELDRKESESRAGATRHVSDSATVNPAGYTRPTTSEPTQIQSAITEHNSVATQANQTKEPTNRHSRKGGNPESFVETTAHLEKEQRPTSLSYSKNRTAPSESLLNPFSFKGRARVRMGVSWKWTALKAEPRPIPILTFPLKGKELTTASQGLTATTSSDVLNGEILNKSVEQTGNTQTATPLDSRLRGNDASSFAENGIDTPINATYQNQITSRAGATRYVLDTTTANSAGYTRPTTPKTTQVQSAVTRDSSAPTQVNQTKEPTSRHSREGGNPVAFVEQAAQVGSEKDLTTFKDEPAPTKSLLNPLPFKGRARVGMGVSWKWTALKAEPRPIPIPTFPLKGKELTTGSQGNDLIGGRISGKPELTGDTQTPTPLDSRLRGNDVSTFVENEIDTPIKTIHQNQTTSRVSAASHLSNETTINLAGYTRPTTPESTQIQSTETKYNSATTQLDQTKEPISRHSREGGNPESFVEQAEQIEDEKNLIALKNKPAPIEAPLNSLPFKGRARVGMGVGWKWAALKAEPRPILIPSFSLKGKDLTTRLHGLTAAIDNDLINDEIPSQSVERTRNTQNPTSLHSRLSGNEVSSFVENEIDTPINAINKNQTTGRAGATRELQKSVDENLASYTRPTISEATHIQSVVTEHHSVTTQVNQTKEPTSRHSREGGNPVAFVEQAAQVGSEKDLTTFKDEPAPTKSLLNSLPFKGRARVGMGVSWKWTALKAEPRPIPIPTFPLKGKELTAMSQGVTAAIDNNLINGGISGKLDEPTGNTQNPTPLDSRLRGNGVSSFSENGIDTLINATNKNQTTSRVGATRELQKSVDENLTSYTRPTTSAATQIQSAVTEHYSVTTQANQTKEPTSRHSREGGNPESFVEQAEQIEDEKNLIALKNKPAPIEAPLNPLPFKGRARVGMGVSWKWTALKAEPRPIPIPTFPLKGKELTTGSQGNDLIGGRISGKPELTGDTQTPTPLDSRLRGNDVSTFVENEIDTPIKTTHQNQTTSRASATSYLSDETTINLAGYTRPTTPASTQIQSTETKYNSATTQLDQTKEPTSRHSREGGNPESFVEQAEQIENEKNLIALKNKPAPIEAPLNSLPFKERARVGMGVGWKWTALKAEPRPIPIPSFPLKGKELTTVSQGLIATTSSDVLNGEILNKSVEQTRNTQNPTSLDSRLRGNDASLFAENGIDTPINATHKNKTTSRAGATRHVSETTTANSAGYTRPTTPEPMQVQSAEAKHNSATTQPNQPKEPTSRHSREGGNPESIDEQAEQIEYEQNPTELSYSTNRTAPSKAPLNSLPLKGMELTAMPQGLRAATDNNLINGGISGKLDEPTGNTQNPTSLDSRLRGNDASPFAENGVDTPVNATHQNQTTSRAGATRHLSDTTTANSAGFNHPTTTIPEITQVQSAEAKRNSAPTQANQTNEPTSRHSREGGNPESFVEQAEQIGNGKNLIALKNETAPIEAPLNSLPFKGRARVGMGVSWKWTALKAEPKPIPIPAFPLKGKELTTELHGLTAAVDNDLISGEILSQSVEQTRSIQTPTSLDSHLRGNDVSTFAENGVDEQLKTTHQNQTTSRVGATRHVSDTTTVNPAGYTRPTTPESTQIQSTETKHISATTQENQTKESSAVPPREDANTAALTGQAAAIKIDQTNTSKQTAATTASQEPTQARHDHLKARLPQRLARALLQADLRELDDVWDKLINEYADLFAQSLRIYLKKAELRHALIAAHTPEKMLESLQVLSPSVSQLLRECWESWSTFSGFTTEKNKSAFQHHSLSLVWDALFDVDLATQTKLTQVRQLVALLLPQPSSQSQTTQPSFAASRHPNYLTQIARLHHRLSASTAPLWHNALTQILTMDSRIAEIAALDGSDLDQADVSLISHEEIRQSLLMELSYQDSVELHIAATWFEQEWQDDSGEPSSAPVKARINSLATYLHQEHAEQSATVHIDHASPAQQHDHLEQLILLTQTTRSLSTAEKIHLRSLFATSLSNAINNESAHTRLQQELHAMLEHDAVIDRLCLCLNDVTLERVFILLHADLFAPAKQIAVMMQSVFAIELCEQADFFHTQAWRLIYRAANDASQEEIILPSTAAATSPRARHFQAALMKEITAHYALGSVSACCEKIRQASVVEAAKISQTHTQTPAQQQTQATRLTKKINKPMPEPEQGEVEAYVLNAGMVIVAPYVQRLFGMLALTRDGAFVDEDAAQRAVHLLQYIVTGESATPEYQLSLNKLLCGIHGGVPIVAGIEITEHEKEVIAQMLQGVIAHWSALGNTSIDGLRQTFFARQGQLRHEEDAWYLQIPQSTFDMLLDRLPWSFAMIKFPWMPEPLHVSWRT